MKIIINKGFYNNGGHTTVLKNGNVVAKSRHTAGIYQIEASNGDEIIVRSSYFLSPSVKLFSFTCKDAEKDYLISPSKGLRQWEWVNFKLLPALLLLTLILRFCVTEDVYNLLALAAVDLTALSWIAEMLVFFFPTASKQLYKIEEI